MYEKQIEKGRLAFYRSSADKAYWDSLWTAHSMKENYFEPYKEGQLDFIEPFITKYIDKGSKVLEAGCGTGKYVVALRQRGYDCVGIDYAERTVEKIKTLLPNVPITKGNVKNMDFQEEHFDSVISLGVVEHEYDGPGDYLLEMHRVLKQGGILLVAVPHFNVLRRAKAKLGMYGGVSGQSEFYQWAFTPGEFRQTLGSFGFSIVDEHDYDYQKNLRDEISTIAQLPYVVRGLIYRIMRYVPGVSKNAGHMRMYIARKAR